MTLYCRLFVISSLVYLLFSGFLGIVMGVNPTLTGYIRYAHIHLMLLGWVSMMIFGLAYHVLPRFVGMPMVSEGWQKFHWWLANIGLIGMVSSMSLRIMSSNTQLWIFFFSIFSLMQGCGILIFCIQMLKLLCPFHKQENSKGCCNRC